MPNTATKSTPRCEFCRKKSIIIITCKCGLNTCILHKAPEEHLCNFDFKNELVMGIKCLNTKIIKIN